MSGLFDVQLPWFIPLYRRVIVVALLLMWTVVEFSRGSPFWGILFGGMGVYCFHQFFIAFNPKMPKDKAAETTSDKTEDKPE
jgi:hypothetical protein